VLTVLDDVAMVTHDDGWVVGYGIILRHTAMPTGVQVAHAQARSASPGYAWGAAALAVLALAALAATAWRRRRGAAVR
jgi:hypothetical protein